MRDVSDAHSRRPSLARWRGLKSLVVDAVEHGSRAIERVQKEMARRPFAILEAIEPLRAPVQIVHVVHDVSVSGVHATIRGVNAAVGTVLDRVIDVIETSPPVPESDPERH